MNSLIMELSGNEDIETVRRLATDFMASYLVSPPAISQRQDGSVPPLVDGTLGSEDAAVVVELLGDVAMAQWVGFIGGKLVVHNLAAARRAGHWQMMAPIAH